MARQKDTFYFDGFRRSADYACQAAKLLSEVMHDFNPGQLRERMDSMHAIEKSADEVRHDMMDELVTAFITPFDREDIDELVANTSGCAIPSELVPTCPECGRPLTPWVYGYEFLEGEHHKRQFERWNAFLEKNINSKIVFLQLGASMKNQEYLKLPFWNMTMQHPDAFYVAIEKQAAFAPPEIEEKALTFEGDIAAILHRAASFE